MEIVNTGRATPIPGAGKNGPEKRVQVKTVLGKNGPGKKGPSDYLDSRLK